MGVGRLVRVVGNEPGARAAAPSGTWALFAFASDSAQLCCPSCCAAALASFVSVCVPLLGLHAVGQRGDGCISPFFEASLTFPARPGHEHAGASGASSKLHLIPDDHFYPSRVRPPEGRSCDHPSGCLGPGSHPTNINTRALGICIATGDSSVHLVGSRCAVFPVLRLRVSSGSSFWPHRRPPIPNPCL